MCTPVPANQCPPITLLICLTAVAFTADDDDDEDLDLSLSKKKKKKKKPVEEDLDDDDDDDLSLSLTKKKKKKKKPVEEAAAVAVAADDDDEDDELSTKKKKKKKKRVDDDDDDDDDEQAKADDEEDDGADYTYRELLERVFNKMSAANPGAPSCPFCALSQPRASLRPRPSYRNVITLAAPAACAARPSARVRTLLLTSFLRVFGCARCRRR